MLLWLQQFRIKYILEENVQGGGKHRERYLRYVLALRTLLFIRSLTILFT